LAGVKSSYTVWDRARRQRVEMPIWNASKSAFYYATPLGRVLTRAVMALPFVSAWQMRSRYKPASRAEIPAFIAQFKVPVDECADPLESYATFNDFFIRRLKPGARPVDASPQAIVSPSDGQILVFPETDAASTFTIKGTRFSLRTVLGDAALARELEGASVASIYLAAYDYHRFHYPFDGELRSRRRLGNRLFVVNPEIAAENGFKPFDHNLRDVNVLQHPALGTVALIEIGAYLVGQVVQLDASMGTKVKGAEKGYFAFGGSSILLAFRKGAVRFDADLVEQSAAGVASLVKMGQRIATVA
jgi:phosphatidylserine decarboxylase